MENRQYKGAMQRGKARARLRRHGYIQTSGLARNRKQRILDYERACELLHLDGIANKGSSKLQTNSELWLSRVSETKEEQYCVDFVPPTPDREIEK